MKSMTNAASQMTLVLSTGTSPRRRWQTKANGRRLILVSNVSILAQAIGALDEFDNYIERIVFDHAASESDTLALIHRLPASFRGDVLIAAREWSTLSTWDGAAGRKVATLTAREVDAYLETRSLTAAFSTAPAFRASAIA